MTTTIHDSGYKKLFSNRTIFRQLIETFVHEDWAKEIDFTQATASKILPQPRFLSL